MEEHTLESPWERARGNQQQILGFTRLGIRRWQGDLVGTPGTSSTTVPGLLTLLSSSWSAWVATCLWKCTAEPEQEQGSVTEVGLLIAQQLREE